MSTHDEPSAPATTTPESKSPDRDPSPPRNKSPAHSSGSERRIDQDIVAFRFEAHGLKRRQEAQEASVQSATTQQATQQIGRAHV